MQPPKTMPDRRVAVYGVSHSVTDIAEAVPLLAFATEHLGRVSAGRETHAPRRPVVLVEMPDGKSKEDREWLRRNGEDIADYLCEPVAAVTIGAAQRDHDSKAGGEL